MIFITKVRFKVYRFHLPIPSQFPIIKKKKELIIIGAWGKKSPMHVSFPKQNECGYIFF